MKEDIDKKTSDDFDWARFKSFFNAVFSYLKKEKNELLSFEKVKQAVRPVHQVYRGLKSIPVGHIRGSEGRYRDFDKEFLPKQENIRPRWQNIDKAHYRNEELPPIQVYQIGDVYFVKDGNHRVSVAKEKGQKYIDAEIIELKARVSLEKDIDYEKLILKEELVGFLEESRIDVLLPGVKFEFTRPGQYDIVMEQIRAHHNIMSSLSGKEAEWDEAVRSWYKTIYLPLVKIIKKHHIMRHFSDLTEADLFMWIIRHWNYLRDRSEKHVDSEYAARHFKETYSRNLLYRMAKFILNIFKINRVLLFLLLTAASLAAKAGEPEVKGPVEPKIPAITNQVRLSNLLPRQEPARQEAQEKSVFLFTVSVIFQDKTILSGITSFPEESLRVSHVKNNILFRKSIDWINVKSIQIQEWKPSLLTQESNARVLSYYFYPSRYRILMASGETFFYEKNIPYLNRLLLTNNDGSADIFSFFADYWTVTGKSTGYWKNTKSTYFYAPFKQGNQKVFRTINFK